jgi:hypothetical protein
MKTQVKNLNHNFSDKYQTYNNTLHKSLEMNFVATSVDEEEAPANRHIS